MEGERRKEYWLSVLRLVQALPLSSAKVENLVEDVLWVGPVGDDGPFLAQALRKELPKGFEVLEERVPDGLVEFRKVAVVEWWERDSQLRYS